jgi:histidinol phosphatase-like enzyme
MLWANLLFALAAIAASPADGIPARGAIGAGFAYTGAPVKLLLLDADQTVRISNTKWRAPRAPSKVVMLPGVSEKIAEYERKGYFVAIMSNQMNAVKDTGLAKIDETMRETVRRIRAGGAQVPYYDFAIQEADAKPGTALVTRLEAALRKRFGPGVKIDRASSLMVGDAAYLENELRPDGRFGFDTANFDRRFAENNGLQFREPQDFFGWKRDRIRNVKELEEYRLHERAGTGSSCAGGFAKIE